MSTKRTGASYVSKHSKPKSNYPPRAPLDPQAIKTANMKARTRFEEQCKIYWENKPYIIDVKEHHELEIKFGTLWDSDPITRNDYDNVVKQLISMNFTTTTTEGDYMLRIQNEYVDPAAGTVSLSKVRTEIQGFAAIQQYCKNNDLEKLIDTPNYTHNVNMHKKDGARYPLSHQMAGAEMGQTDFHDFGFRSGYSMEEQYNVISRFGIVKGTVENWHKSKKTFRYINRVTFVHPDYPVKIDISIVKSSKMKENGKDMQRTFNTGESGVFQSKELFEIEIEVDTALIGPGTKCDTVTLLVANLRKCIKFVMMGLQETNYPISVSEKKRISNEYLALIRSPSATKGACKLYTNQFIGPNSQTLQINHIVDNTDNALSIPNIRNNYTVTDKADGERRMLFVAKNGHIYLLNSNMKLLFTGAKTDNEELANTLIDGEIIAHDKNGRYINLFAAFDIYFVNNKDVRANQFHIPPDKESDKNKSRLHILHTAMNAMDVKPIGDVTKSAPIRLSVKQFYASSARSDIFSGCSTILKREASNLFEYTTDGLIFTPSDLGVGSNKVGEAGPLRKSTWNHSFKWKPPQFNTIDFMVSVVSGEDNIETKKTIFEPGLNTATASQHNQYKTLELRCGFTEGKDGYINPCQDMLDGKLREYNEDNNNNNNYRGSSSSSSSNDDYMPMRFYPTDPYDADAGICNIMLHRDSNGDDQMHTEEGEVFNGNTIVEFRYAQEREHRWRWVPIRVRHDKTTQLRLTQDNFGNSYQTANSNWHSIHNPITDEMIMTGTNLPIDVRDDDVYYNRKSSTSETKGLRDFHNLYVKMSLIKCVSRPGDTLIDFACGKGGDLSKWIQARLSFVFGIDLSKDNIENRMDGACARYLTQCKKTKSVPGALFIHGNSEHNIRRGDALISEKSKQVAAAVFGNNPKDPKLGNGVAMYHGIGEDGFNVSSCQFALHYFFKDKHVFHRFMRNVAECTKVGGFFVGTCYDGKKIFNMLKAKKLKERVELYTNKTKIWGITKLYEKDMFSDDETSLGYTIGVYQETINKEFDEYLVNFDYLIRTMENYGFQVANDKDAQEMGLPAGSGSFEELYNQMTKKIRINPRSRNDYGFAANMPANDKEISFKNRYFVFKKISNVDISRVVAVEQETVAPDRYSVMHDEVPSTTNADESVSKIETEDQHNTVDVETGVETEVESEGKKKSSASKSSSARARTRKPRLLNKTITLQESSSK